MSTYSPEANRSAGREWYARMNPEQKKEFNKEKYLKYKSRHNRQSKQWAKDNPHKGQASTHQATIKKTYPEKWETTDIETKELSEWLKENRGTPCKYCKAEATHIDHKIPLSKGGEHRWDNIQMLCKQCNISKYNYSEQEFFSWLFRIKIGDV